MALRLTTEDILKITALIAPGTGKQSDRLARALGFKDGNELMEAAHSDAQAGPSLSIELNDWRAAGGAQPAEVSADDKVIGAPIRAVVSVSGGESIDVLLGGAELDYGQPGASSVRVEREGDTTRFMIYDANCEAPRVFGVKDGEPLCELPNDWESRPRPQPDDELPQAGY